LESFRPGVLERLGFTDLLADPGRLVICRISGYGQSGPWRDRAGHDIGYVGLAGVIARNRGVPAVQLGDLFGGAHGAVIGVLAALVERARTGRGRVVDVAMAQGATGLLLPHLGEGAHPPENMLDGSRPCYRVYACKGGGWYALGALEPKFWERFCAAVGRPQWEDRAMDAALAGEADALFATRTREEWDAALRNADCCGEVVLEPAELREHALFKDLYVGELPRTFPALAPTQTLPTRPAPERGQHTAEVLGEWCSR
jgi:crotonobetainyl-CoA:carnitine CoA-transferase CaiB-like acyl-CoA transferase